MARPSPRQRVKRPSRLCVGHIQAAWQQPQSRRTAPQAQLGRNAKFDAFFAEVLQVIGEAFLKPGNLLPSPDWQKKPNKLLMGGNEAGGARAEYPRPCSKTPLSSITSSP